MSSKNLQIIYESEPKDPYKIHWLWTEESKAMEAAGISVGTKTDENISKLIYRGGRSLVKEKYEKDNRYINEYNHMTHLNSMSYYFKYIDDLSIETFFADELCDKVVDEIFKREWTKAFIKKDIKSLEFIDLEKSIWPNTTFDEMKLLYRKYNIEGVYAIRKFIAKKYFDREERYWVLNGNIYHRHNNIPDIVKEAAKRLNKLGSKYYTIDATTEFVVEVNPGESSDRHAVNSAELFASWIKKEFYYE